MTKIEKLFYTVILGFIPPVLLFTGIWFTLYALFPERTIFPFPFVGMATGILIDIISMKRWLASCYQCPYWILILIFSFYHIGMFGFFMGFPVFNSFLGIIAGFYFGNRILKNNFSEEKKKKMAAKIALITTFFMLLICISSGTIALISPSTPSDLEGLLHLNFDISRGILIFGIITGGIVLIVFSWWITLITMKKVMTNKFK